MMAALIFINYHFRLETQIITQLGRSTTRFFAFWALYAGVFAGAYMLTSLFYCKWLWWKQARFLLLLLASTGIFAWQQHFYLHRQWVAYHYHPNYHDYYSLSYEYLIRVLLLLIPCYIIWWFFDRKEMRFYGFQPNREGYRPYFLMLLMAIPLIAFASTQSDFLAYYPKAAVVETTRAGGVYRILLYLQFELAYGCNFITIESFFRGLLVLGFARLAGKHAILPMACFYCSIHFGKPLFECISSLFGGLLLGIISYHTRSIYGGLMVHLGIAWMMELGAFIGNTLTH